MHTDPTLEHLRRLTPEIGRLMRDFKNTTCAQFEMFELRQEVAARGRREIRTAKAGATADGLAFAEGHPAPDVALAAPTQTRKKKKTGNLNTYKWHALGDYITTILLFGPTDGCSTQLGESLHRLVKRMYAVTNKREHAGQIATKVMRLARGRALIESMANKVDHKLQLTKSADNGTRKRRLRLMQRRQSQSKTHLD
ncbi:hypothetical protein B0H14DRAFT_1215337 [Mycena olivaceomarginata]|nr:hypothetical protein B0H14DRAFT_1215337 [Mycena olivaceomarginata]